MMLTTWLGAIALVLGTQSAAIPAVLPDTPQARQLYEYVKAFNAGEAPFVAMYDAATIPAMAAQTPPARRSELYKQLVGQVGTIKLERVVSSSPKSISFSMRVPGKGSTATFTFTFEDKEPFRIASVDMELSAR